MTTKRISRTYKRLPLNPDKCSCTDCLPNDQEFACSFDCEPRSMDECRGCIEHREEQEEIDHDARCTKGLT